MAAARPPFTQIPLIVAVIVAGIVIVFLAQTTYETKQELKRLADEALEARQATISRGTTNHFATLDQNCTWCHNERRFLGFHGDSKAIDDVVHRMQDKADAKLTDAELRQIHSAMDLLACIKCHDRHTLDKFATYSADKQKTVLEGMWRKPGSGLKEADSTRIISALHAIQGF